MSDGLKKLTGGLDTIFPGLGSLTGQLLGGLDAPDMSDAPKQVEQQTGNIVGSKGAASFDEEADAKGNARKTARKGTSQFRIPLAGTASTSGTKTAGSSGLKI